MKADFTGSVKPGSELAPPLTDDIACLGLIGSVLTSRIQVLKGPPGRGSDDDGLADLKQGTGIRVPEAAPGEAAAGLQMEVETGPMNAACLDGAVGKVGREVGLVGRFIFREPRVSVDTEHGPARGTRVGDEVVADGRQRTTEGADEPQHGIAGFGFVPRLVLAEPLAVVMRLQVLEKTEEAGFQQALCFRRFPFQLHGPSREESSFELRQGISCVDGTTGFGQGQAGLASDT